jgi:quercetin dioxygenase-like cupin family protein
MRTSPSIAAFHVQFLTVPPAAIAHNWHPAPARQFVLLLKGELEGEVSDGERRAFAPGSIIFVEDTKGKGHKDHAVNDDELLLALIPVPDENDNRAPSG